MKEIILEGEIKVIFGTQVINDSFSKKEFVIITDEKYPQEVKVEVVNDTIQKLDAFKVGDKIKASVNIRGRFWTNKQGKDVYFVSLNAWRIEAEAAQDSTEFASAEPPVDSFGDELPFSDSTK